MFIIALMFLAAIIFFPEFKATVLRGFMTIGLFEPDIKVQSNETHQGQPALTKATSVEFISSTGEKLNLDGANDKVIFLNFWATWCPPCIAEMPSIQALKNKLKNKEAVVFAMVDADSNLQSSLSFMKKHNYDLPVYVQTNDVPESLFNGSLPTTVIINKKGEIVMKHEGLGNYDTKEMLNLLNSLSQ